MVDDEHHHARFLDREVDLLRDEGRHSCLHRPRARPCDHDEAPPVALADTVAPVAREPREMATSASRVPVSRLNSVDLPTFGRLTSATAGSTGAARAAFFRRARCTLATSCSALHDDVSPTITGPPTILPLVALARDEVTIASVEEVEVALVVAHRDRVAEARAP